MKHLAREISGALPTVKFVAKDRMAEVMKVDANLVGASTVDRAFDQARVTTRTHDAIFGPGRAARALRDAHFFAMNGMTRDRRLDCAE